MKPAISLFVLCLSLTAHASGVDDALTSVRAAQGANDAGPACQGLSTKLKLAVEALQDAAKAPARKAQAKGRVELAKDFAASSCTGPVAEKVTQALTAALAALDKPEEAKGPAKKGADFKAPCHANDECASEICFVGASGAGYCSKKCAAASDCPAKWECRRPGSEAQTVCIAGKR
jgi:hypothetical protein